MHNGCLLLLALVAVFQPIASYTERGLVDGRLHRCDHRTSVRDPGLNFHGTYRFNKPAVDNQRLNHREDIREVRRHEIREENHHIPSSSDRRLADTPERDRNTLTRLSRDRFSNDALLQYENRAARVDSRYRKERNQEARRERFSKPQEARQARFDSRRGNGRLSEDEDRSQRIDKRRLTERVSVGFRRDTCGNGISRETQRVRELREINRAMNSGASNLNERRIASEDFQRMDRDTRMDREFSDRRFSRVLRSSLTSGNGVNRAYEDTKSLDRNDRRSSISQRFLDGQRQRDSRSSLEVEQRKIRDTASRRVRDDRTSENRKDGQRAQYADSRREVRDTENRDRLTRIIRSVDGVSHNYHSGSRRFTREAENRRQVVDARKAFRTLSLERRAENRKDNRFIERDPQENIITNRPLETRNINRDTRDHERRLSTEERMARMTTRTRSQEGRQHASNAEIRAFRNVRPEENRRVVRQISAQPIRTEQFVQFGEDRRDSRNVEMRAFRTERSDKSGRNTRERHQDARRVAVRSFKAEGFDESQRITPNIQIREYKIERTDQDKQADARNNRLRSFRTLLSEETRRNSRIIGTDRSDESRRENRNSQMRSFRTEHTQETRRHARSVDVRALRTGRDDENRREARIIGARALRIDRTYASNTQRRETRAIERQYRSLDRITDSRRNVRKLESRTEDERTNNRRAARSLERDIRSIRMERSMEKRLNEKTKRDTLELRSNKERRSMDAQGRRVESRRVNLIRSGDDLRQQKPDRSFERLSKQEAIESRRTYNQRESRKASETNRTSDRHDLTIQHEADIFRNPTHTSYEPTIMNWQYVFYTLQGLYIIGLLMQLNKGGVEKKTRFSWLPAPQRLIKVE